MVQAAVLDGLVFDASPFSQDGFAAPEVDVCRGEVADALVVAVVVVMVDEDIDFRFQFALKEVLFQKDAVLEGLVPAFDFALGLLMRGRTANVRHAFTVQVSISNWGLCRLTRQNIAARSTAAHAPHGSLRAKRSRTKAPPPRGVGGRNGPRLP